jgi:hypothetical protein
MPITPAAIKARIVALNFEYAGETVNLTYRPAAINEKAVARLQKLQDQTQANAGDESTGTKIWHELAVYYCELIASWDFLQDDGVTPQPLTVKHVTGLLQEYIDFMGDLLTAIMRHRSAGNANGTTPS